MDPEEPFLDRLPLDHADAPSATDAPDGRVLALLHARTGADRAPIAVRSAQAIIGTDPGSDVVLAGRQVAKRHAQLRLRGGLWTLVDFGSPGGSIVDGDQVRGEAILAPGSAVRLGEMLFAFAPHDRWEDSPAERRGGDRTPLLVIPDHARSTWPRLALLLALAGIIAVAFLLLRSA